MPSKSTNIPRQGSVFEGASSSRVPYFYISNLENVANKVVVIWDTKLGYPIAVMLDQSSAISTK